jgi:peptidoglycan lytic transglycosylase
VRFWQDINTAVAVGVFVVSSCVEQRSPKPIERPSTPVEPVPPEATSPAASIVQAGYATFYARRFSGRRTANGEKYDPSQLTAAHRTIPFGTLIDVRRADGDGRHVVVRINDRGPYVSNRIIDLSRRAAEELGIVHDGKAWVELRLFTDLPFRAVSTSDATDAADAR